MVKVICLADTTEDGVFTKGRSYCLERILSYGAVLVIDDEGELEILYNGEWKYES